MHYSLARSTICLSILLLIWTFSQVNDAKSPYLDGCTEKNVQKIDKAVAKLLGFGPHGRTFPENVQQLKGYCQETNKLINQIDGTIKKCFQKEVRDLANVLVYSLKSNVRQFCRRRNKKLAKLIASTSCINRNIRDDRCTAYFTNTTKQLIGVQADDQTKIKYACCNYVTSMRCVDDWLDGYGCTADKEVMVDFVRGVFGSFSDVMCGEYNESNNLCDELGEQPKPVTANRKHYLSFLFVLVDLMESFKNLEILG